VKQGTKILLVVLAVIAIASIAVYSNISGTYNKLVVMDEEVKSKWSQVENMYQRRMDLIPNLVETVKGYASHESETFTQLAEARSKAGGVVNIDGELLDDPEAFQRYQQAQSELSGALQRLLMVSENYPELKANQNFLALQDQLEGTENRISVERKRYNDTVKIYNIFVKQFPRVIIANMAGFGERPYFEASEGADKAPEVKF